MQTKKRLTKFKLACFAVLTVIVAAFAAVMIFAHLFPLATFNVLGVRFYRISYTKSMEPQLNYNDLIAVRRYNFYKLKTGDIVTFYTTAQNGSTITVTHKIIDIKDDLETGKRYLRTQGVNIAKPDLMPVTIDGADGTNKYIGKLAFKSAFLGNLQSYLLSGYGMLMIVINTSGLMLLKTLFKQEKSHLLF